MKTFERILAATDFSAASQPALEAASKIASDCGARLIFLHSYRVPMAADLSYAPANIYEDFERAVRADGEKQIEALVALARARGIDAAGLLQNGFADEEILAAAEKEKADLIVMGTHGRRGASRLLLGSIAARVVSRASCPVMTIRAKPARPHAGEASESSWPPSEGRKATA